MGRIFGTPVSQEELEALVKELGPPTTSSSTRAWTLTMEELEAKVAYLEAQAKKPNLCWHERIELRNHDVIPSSLKLKPNHNPKDGNSHQVRNN